MVSIIYCCTAGTSTAAATGTAAAKGTAAAASTAAATSTAAAANTTNFVVPLPVSGLGYVIFPALGTGQM